MSEHRPYIYTDEDMAALNRGGDAAVAALYASRVEFQVSSANGDSRRQVNAIAGGKLLHVDKLDLADAFKRQKFCETVKGKMLDARIGAPEVADLEAKLLAALVAADQRAETERAEWFDVEPRAPVLVAMSTVQATAIKWLWRSRMALARITLLVGMPGVGKSFLTADVTARVTTGSPFPDGSPCERGSVILICGEDDPADTIRPRLDAHRADVGRVHLLTSVRHTGANGKPQEVMFTLKDVQALEDDLRRVPDCKLIVVDPIGSFMGNGTDSHRDNEVRAVLAPVSQLAQKYGPAVLLVAHRRKSAGSVADDLALGSRAYTGIARAVWHLSRDAEKPSRRLLLPGKNNLALEGGGLAFGIGGDPPQLRWERDAVAMTADEALAAENAKERKKPGPEPREQDKAVRFLRDALAKGPRPAKELIEEAREAQGINKTTLERAKATANVESFQRKKPGPWWWRLPGGQNVTMPEAVEPDDLDGLGKTPGETALGGGVECPDRQDVVSWGPGDGGAVEFDAGAFNRALADQLSGLPEQDGDQGEDVNRLLDEAADMAVEDFLES
jgi:putative DNA primase/helicase